MLFYFLFNSTSFILVLNHLYWSCCFQSLPLSLLCDSWFDCNLPVRVRHIHMSSYQSNMIHNLDDVNDGSHQFVHPQHSPQILLCKSMLFFLFIIVFNCLVDCILALKVIIQLCKPILCSVVEFVCPNNL